MSLTVSHGDEGCLFGPDSLVNTLITASPITLLQSSYSYKSKCLLIMCDLPKCLSLSSSAAVAAASACTSAFAASLATAGGRAEVPNGASVPNSCFFCTSQCKRCFTVYLPRTSTSAANKRGALVVATHSSRHVAVVGLLLQCSSSLLDSFFRGLGFTPARNQQIGADT